MLPHKSRMCSKFTRDFKRANCATARKGVTIGFLIQFNTIETGDEIKVPVVTAELAISDRLKANVFLEGNDLADVFILEFF